MSKKKEVEVTPEANPVVEEVVAEEIVVKPEVKPVDPATIRVEDLANANENGEVKNQVQ